MNKRHKRRKELIKRRNERHNEPKINPFILYPNRNIDVDITSFVSSKLKDIKNNIGKYMYEFLKVYHFRGIHKANEKMQQKYGCSMSVDSMCYKLVSRFLYSDDKMFPEYFLDLGMVKICGKNYVGIDIDRIDVEKSTNGKLYYNSNSDPVMVDGKKYQIKFTRHSIERLTQRVIGCNSISVHTIYFYDCCLDEYIIKRNGTYLLPLYNVADKLLLGYFVSEMRGNDLVVQTFVIPGMKGTPEEHKLPKELRDKISNNNGIFANKVISEINEYTDKPNRIPDSKYRRLSKLPMDADKIKELKLKTYGMGIL